jgi:hypothetical protein
MSYTFKLRFVFWAGSNKMAHQPVKENGMTRRNTRWDPNQK